MVDYTKCSFDYCETTVGANDQIFFPIPSNLPANTYLLAIFQKAQTTSLAVDIDCSEAVAWVMTDDEYFRWKLHVRKWFYK